MQLSVMTYNIWGPPWHFSRDRAARMPRIGEQLRALGPDVIALQEAYSDEDRQTLRDDLADWPYQHRFASGVGGSGLWTLSRYPILDAAFHRFRMGGRPEDIRHADYYVGKGIGLVRIDTPAGVVDVYNLHPPAQYSPEDINAFTIFTDASLYECARFIDSHSQRNPVIVCGDFNTRPHQVGYQLITALAHLTDVYTHLHPDDPGITFDAENPYTGAYSQRLDYIMVRSGTDHSLQPNRCEIVMTERLTDGALAYSDHYGVLAHLTLQAEPTPVYHAPEAAHEAISFLHNNLQIATSDMHIKRAQAGDRTFLGLAALGDLTLFGGILIRRLPFGGVLRALLVLITAAYTLMNAYHNHVNLRAQQNTLHALTHEIEHQLRAKRLFNGDSWEADHAPS